MLNGFDFILLIVAITIFGIGIYRRVARWRVGQPEDRFRHKKIRFRSLWENGILQLRLMRQKTPGLMHLFLFWGFMLPLGLIILLNLHVLLDLPDWLATGFSLLLDICGVLALIGLAIAVYRRYIQRLEQLDRQWDDFIGLLLIFLIVLTGLLNEGLRLNITQPENTAWSPIGWLFGLGFRLFETGETQLVLHRIIRRIHLFSVLGFIACLPFSKLRHIITSPLNIYFKSIKPNGELTTLDIENSETFGVANIEDYTWKQLLDLDACTKCGRCELVCPAHLSEKPLSPKNLILDLKKHWLERSQTLLASNQPETANEEFPESEIIGKVLSEDIIWACTSCRACQEACPVQIEHIQKIIDLRRHLALMLGRFPEEVQTVFRNLNANSNPWGIGYASRGDWAQDSDVPKFTGDDEEAWLYYVGCAGSFDERARKVSTAFVKILRAAGIKFGILGAAEKCCGDSARRIGEEYLFQTLAQENVAIFQQYKIKKIVTTCPHGYNTLKNEYPAFGGNFQVLHAVELIADLLRQGRLKLKAPFLNSVALHDSCYLGRYNNLYQQPREILSALVKDSPLEMADCREQSFCCGAGGGRMWFEEHLGQRINEVRTDQALAVQPEAVAVSCPFCLTMFEDGMKEKGVADKVKIYDLIEFVAQAL